MLKVAKFGGTSMADAVQFQKIRDIVRRDPDRQILVVSAPGKRFPEDHKVTDLLYLCHAHLKYDVNADEVFGLVKERFLSIRDELRLPVDLEGEFSALEAEMKAGISEEKLVSRGEYFAAKLMAAFLGFDFVDAADLLIFRLDGTIDEEATNERIQAALTGRPAVVPGFYGALPDGAIRLLTRGGSDISGAILAAALSADVYENWTDVSGILMADPRIVPGAKPIPRITYLELRELSYIGAKVLHEDSIEPVRRKNIALNIRNTNEPDHPGTIIREAFDGDEDAKDAPLVTGIAGKTGFTAITVTKGGMSSMVGAFRRILGVFQKYGITVAYTTSGIDCYSLIVEEALLSSLKYTILSEIEAEMQPDRIQVAPNLAVLAVVGRRMVLRAGSSARIFQTLGSHEINIRMISQGPEELNVIVGVHGEDFKKAVRVIYETMIE